MNGNCINEATCAPKVPERRTTAREMSLTANELALRNLSVLDKILLFLTGEKREEKENERVINSYMDATEKNVRDQEKVFEILLKIADLLGVEVQ